MRVLLLAELELLLGEQPGLGLVLGVGRRRSGGGLGRGRLGRPHQIDALPASPRRRGCA
ncbi:MAG: hypothetical protein RML12_10620 [Xanthomonadales bacterium]|nr:hypothetical protein [Xanthomonadales bacterium]